MHLRVHAVGPSVRTPPSAIPSAEAAVAKRKVRAGRSKRQSCRDDVSNDVRARAGCAFGRSEQSDAVILADRDKVSTRDWAAGVGLAWHVHQLIDWPQKKARRRRRTAGFFVCDASNDQAPRSSGRGIEMML
jgi:hypothetical protein